MDNEVTFRVDQWVTWRNGLSDYELQIVKSDGPGPFRVTAVKEVPTDECYCGRKLKDCRINPPDHIPLRQSVGHSQWVKIARLDGTNLTGLEGAIQNFSGAWFVPTDPPAAAQPQA